MRRWLFALLICLLPWMAQAEVEIPPLQHRVTDLTGTLSSQQQADLEARLAAFEAKKGSQIAILLVPTTQPEDIAQYAIRVVDAWKLGRKGVNDGVLVLLAKDDHRSRIEVGYGLEGALPDVIAKRIVSDVMRPYLKQGDFYGALQAGVEKIEAVIDGEPLPSVSPKQSDRDGLGDIANNFFLFAIGALVLGVFFKQLLGNVMGSLVNAGLAGMLLWWLGIVLPFAIMFAVFVFFATLSGNGHFGGYSRGGSGGGGFSDGGGFSGGGGSFGGGGASGDW